MALPDGHAERRDALIAVARRIVKNRNAAFAETAKQLDELYSESTTIRLRPSLGGRSGRACLYGRFDVALTDAINPAPSVEKEEAAGRFDFDESDKSVAQGAAARLFILIVLLAIDAEAHEAIEPGWGEIVSLPWDAFNPDTILGRATYDWSFHDKEWRYKSSPPPRVLDRFERTIRKIDPKMATSPPQPEFADDQRESVRSGVPVGVDLSKVADEPAEELIRAATWYLRCAGNFEQSLTEISGAVESTQRWATTQDLVHADDGKEPDETVEIDGEMYPVIPEHNPWPGAIQILRIWAPEFFGSYVRLREAVSKCHTIVGPADADLRRISTLASKIHGTFPS